MGSERMDKDCVETYWIRFVAHTAAMHHVRLSSIPGQSESRTSYSGPYPSFEIIHPATFHDQATKPIWTKTESTICLKKPAKSENLALSLPYAWDLAKTPGLKCSASAGGGASFE